ncbi:hypothetical protein D9758_015203 [Tetrapyrgos nigripes]|uniref:Uncharacterized protein n=1 Tax=Tetrapyrgos nigripes TaxID=182062 RepID=A0A8H5CJV4_9AGAR|nr:hypothetical protein D9758_015203 [Tetrapyrgos nigripes]
MKASETKDGEDADYEYGGFGDEKGDDEENPEVTGATGRSIKIKAKSLAAVVQPTIVKVEPTNSEDYVAPTSIKKRGIRLGNLPEAVQTAFKDKFIPAIIEFTGCLIAWTSPNVNELEQTWEDVMPEDICQRFTEFNTGKVIETLTQDRLNSWRNSIGKAALKAIEQLFQREGLSTPEERRCYVKEQTTGDYKSHPYYYSHAVEMNGKTMYAGPFQSFIISKTFSEHLKAIAKVTADQRLSERPTGAMVLSILAVHRAFTFYSSGNEVIPSGVDGHFASAIWGDRDVTLEGKVVRFETTTNLHSHFAVNPIKNINRCSAAQWDRIIQSAEKHLLKPVSKPKLNKKSTASEPPTPDPAEDWELPDIDPDELLAQAKHAIPSEIAASAQDDGENDSRDVEMSALNENAESEEGREDEGSEGSGDDEVVTGL